MYIESRAANEVLSFQRQEELVAKLKAMESKITAGSQVMQQAAEQEKELRKAQVALERQRQKGTGGCLLSDTVREGHES